MRILFVRVYYDSMRTYAEPRLFPYAAASPAHAGYIDFKSKPELIRTSLEDFKNLNHWPAVQTFYSFLEWMNGGDSKLETNDSALRGPYANKDKNSNRALAIDGRIILLYRDLRLNSSTSHSDWLCGKLMQVLDGIDEILTEQEGVVGFTLNPVLQLAISNAVLLGDDRYNYALDDPGFGRHLMLSFWAYGNDDAEVFTNLDRLFGNLWTACKSISDEIHAGVCSQQKNQLLL